MTDLDTLSVGLRRKRSTFDQRLGEHRALLALAERTEAEVESLKIEMVELDKTAAFLTSIGEEQQFKAQAAIEALVTEGLQTIFDDTLSFHILQKVNGKTATVEFVVQTALPGDRVVSTSVLEARGGGLAAVIGFLLRLVVLLLKRDDNQKLLVLDEVFAHVSAEYLPGLAEFLRKLVDKTDVQILLVTHQEELTETADKIYKFSTKDGNTQVKELTHEH